MTDVPVSLLIIEDDEIDQLAYKRYLRAHDDAYRAVIVQSVNEAKEMLKQDSFDCAIIDYLLKDGTSFDVFDALGDIPGIIVTGAGDTEIAVSAMKSGAYDYLIKDPDGNYLKTMPMVIHHAIENRKQKEELRQYREKLEELVRQRTGDLEQEVAVRKQAETKLSEINRQYRTFVENCVVGIYRIDFDEPVSALDDPETIANSIMAHGYFAECNDALLGMYGVASKEEMLRIRLSDLIVNPDDTRKRLVTFIENGFKTELIDNSEYDADKKMKYFRNSYTGLVHNGLLKWIWGIQTDISERKVAEHAQQVLYDIASDALKAESPGDLFKKIHSSIDMIVDASNLAIILADKDTDELEIVYSTADEDLAGKVPSKKSLTRYLIDNDLSLLLSANDIELLITQGKCEMVGRPAQSWMGVPMRIGDDVTGAIVLQSYTNPDLYNYKHLEFLSFISSQIAVAIERNIRDEQIRSSLREKEVLLKEVHHRVKNNLQVISSLLSLQSKQVHNKQALALFKETHDRVRSISMVHERLYASKDFARIDFNEYVRNLTRELFRTYGMDPSSLTITYDIEAVWLDVEMAVPCGLVINELISNSLKYAFPGMPNVKGAAISVSMRKVNSKALNLVVSDNGVGISDDIDLANVKTLGLKLVSILVTDQLQGSYDIVQNNGLEFRIVIPL